MKLTTLTVIAVTLAPPIAAQETQTSEAAAQSYNFADNVKCPDVGFLAFSIFDQLQRGFPVGPDVLGFSDQDTTPDIVRLAHAIKEDALTYDLIRGTNERILGAATFAEGWKLWCQSFRYSAQQ